jgi:heme-degrading monooxygenase HmoA
VVPVFARVSRFKGDPGGVDQMRAYVEEHVVPAARQLEGFRGLLALGDRGSGASLSVTLWETEEAMRASEAAADEMRKGAAAAGGEEIVSVERYEVLLDLRS